MSLARSPAARTRLGHSFLGAFIGASSAGNALNDGRATVASQVSRVFCYTPRSHRREGQFHTVPTTVPAAQDTNRGRIQTASAADERVFARIAWRLMPLLIAGYILNYLDRNNVGFAALTMNRALGLTATQFGRAGGIFFLGYCFFELPSNIALYRVGPRVWLARIMITGV